MIRRKITQPMMISFNTKNVIIQKGTPVVKFTEITNQRYGRTSSTLPLIACRILVYHKIHCPSNLIEMIFNTLNDHAVCSEHLVSYINQVL